MKSKIASLVLLSIMLLPFAALANLTQTDISQLYVAIFNRASEGEGNRYWQTLELDMATTADVMLETDAAKGYFGNSLDSNQAFMEHIYYNTLNKTRAEDPDGIAYWVGLLDDGSSRGSVVANLVSAIIDYAPGGAYYDPDSAATIAAYNQFVNRLMVSNYMADNVYEAADDWETNTSFNSMGLNVTYDEATLYAAMDIIDGGTPFLLVTPKIQNVGSDAGTVSFLVSNNGTGSMVWTAEVSSGRDWLTISSGKRGSDTGTINCVYGMNSEGADRTATVRVSSAGATDSPVVVKVIQAELIFDSFDSMFRKNPSSSGVNIQGYWQAGSSFSFSITNNSDLVFKLSKAELKNGNDIVGSSSDKSLLSDGLLEPSESVGITFTLNRDSQDNGFAFIYYLEDISTGETFEIQHEYEPW